MANSLKKNFALFRLIKHLRSFFEQQDFMDVLTPPAVPQPGMEAHIHPFQLYKTKDRHPIELYLQTSPEFYMKQLLAEGYQKLFNISYCFRDEPQSPQHRPQFIMLEWYRAQVDYSRIMQDCQELLEYCRQELQKDHLPVRQTEELKLQKTTVQSLFWEYLNMDILEHLEIDKLYHYISQHHSDISLNPNYHYLWDDLYFLLFLNKIEPRLADKQAILIYEFPAPLCALANLKPEDPRVSLRFEIYINGVELCNCFQELTDYKENKYRFQQQNKVKLSRYAYQLPEPRTLFDALEKGLPNSAGVALGVERLLMSLCSLENYFFE